jgi:hypothetical protein
MYPTGWAWLTIAFGLALPAAFLLWRPRHRRRGWAEGIFGVLVTMLVILFLFSLVQWASWYK